MTSENNIVEFELPSKDLEKIQTLLGSMNDNVRLIESQLSVLISNRANLFMVEGEYQQALKARAVIEKVYADILEGKLTHVDKEVIHFAITDVDTSFTIKSENNGKEIIIKTLKGTIKGRGENQRNYLSKIFDHDVNFGLGPAGTGKTYLAVACAVAMLNEDLVRKIILVRPAVEAGERLGFLPGDLAQKIDPYLRPLYDALYEMLGSERTLKLIEKQIIEVAPLAFMRGRTLSDAFIVLDEAQNTTKEQMKMFLTRVGFGSKAVITGDLSQIDLPKGIDSGLKEACGLLKDIKGISFTHFSSKDVVRHPLVRRIIEAYDKAPKMYAKDTHHQKNN